MLLRFYLIFILAFPFQAVAGWVYFDPALTADVPVGGSILCRTYAVNTTGVTSPIYTDPFAFDLDGSGIMIQTNGGKPQLSTVTPYPPLTADMTTFNSTPAEQWFQLFDRNVAAAMFSTAFLLIVLSGAVAHGMGVMISMFNRR